MMESASGFRDREAGYTPVAPGTEEVNGDIGGNRNILREEIPTLFNLSYIQFITAKGAVEPNLNI